MPQRHVVVATHGHCFDGLASAVMFTRLMRHLEGGDLRFTYRASGYGPGQNGVLPEVLSGDVNAILDFRFTATPRLTWYFDHHVSAFTTPADRGAYDARVGEDEAAGQRRWFHDGAYSSCTKLIADVGRERFSFGEGEMAELVRWADLIDSASFTSAEMAVARREPELALMTVVEHVGGDGFLAEYVPRLLETPLHEVASSEAVTKLYVPLKATHEAFVEQVKRHAVVKGRVVLVDLTSETNEVSGKFVTYALFPASVYSIVVTRSKTKCKLSIGYNPWAPAPRTHSIADICQRYGGGGHPAVGAISLPAGDAERARQIADEITRELET